MLATGLVLLLLVAGAINGWRWTGSGSVVVARIERSVAELPIASPISGRVLFISPHPDDETLAAGGIIQDIIRRGGSVEIVFLTNGDGFSWDARATQRRTVVRPADMLALGRTRMQEAVQATARLGVDRSHVTFLGFPDRGLTSLYLQNYLVPYRSAFTGRDHVPYSGTLVPGAPYTGHELERELTLLFERLKPEVVIVPSVLDNHPDHKTAAYVSTRLASESGARLYSYIVHGGLEWPLPKGLHTGLPLAPPKPTQQGITWQKYPLSAGQLGVKAQAMNDYRTQVAVTGRFMQAFIRTNELLLPAPTPGTPPDEPPLEGPPLDRPAPAQP